MAHDKLTVIDRFMSKVEIVTESGCWIWMGFLDKGGYGSFDFAGKKIKHPKAAWTVLRGKIPPGLEPDHLCRVRCCVNPDHMELVTHRINCQRGNAGKHFSDRTHCPKGHPYSGDNLSIKKSGARRCMACSRAYDEAKRRLEGAQPRATTCPRGHLFTPQNTKILKRSNRTQRLCMECIAIRSKRLRETRKGLLHCSADLALK